METISLTGKWLVKSVSNSQNGEKVYVWQITWEDKNGELTGTGIDITNIIAAEEVTILKGVFEQNMLDFQRMYKHLHTIQANGEVITKENTPYEVHYNGHYSEFLDCFTGQWRIFKNGVSSNGHGTFEMKRISN